MELLPILSSLLPAAERERLVHTDVIDGDWSAPII